ncbi:MAG: LysR substrate-binding domain-containing protein [Polyangiaceae bacterium]
MDLSALTLTQLRYLVAVESQRSFRGAAELSHVSQPALSMQVQKAEDLLGLAIFDRSQQPVVPTEAGVELLQQARVVLREVDRFRDIVTHERPLSGRYRLGVIPTLATTLLPLLLPRFCAAFPEVELVVEETQTSVLIERLLSDQLDGGLAATPLDTSGIHERVLFQEPLYAYLSPKHALAKKKLLRQSDLVGEHLWLMAEGHCFRTQVMQLCRIDRRSTSSDGVRFESGSFETLVQLVDRGFGVTVLPALSVERLQKRQLQRVRPFAAPTPVREVSFVHAREHLRRPIGDAIVESLLAELPASVTQRSQRRAVLAPT